MSLLNFFFFQEIHFGWEIRTNPKLNYAFSQTALQSLKASLASLYQTRRYAYLLFPQNWNYSFGFCIVSIMSFVNISSFRQKLFSEAELMAKKYRQKLPAVLSRRSESPQGNSLPFDRLSMYANWKWFKFEKEWNRSCGLRLPYDIWNMKRTVWLAMLLKATHPLRGKSKTYLLWN